MDSYLAGTTLHYRKRSMNLGVQLAPLPHSSHGYPVGSPSLRHTWYACEREADWKTKALFLQHIPSTNSWVRVLNMEINHRLLNLTVKPRQGGLVCCDSRDCKESDTTKWLNWTELKITADGDCSHEIKRCLLLGRKVMTNLDSIFKAEALLCQQRSV